MIVAICALVALSCGLRTTLPPSVVSLISPMPTAHVSASRTYEETPEPSGNASTLPRADVS